MIQLQLPPLDDKAYKFSLITHSLSRYLRNRYKLSHDKATEAAISGVMAAMAACECFGDNSSKNSTKDAK